MDCSPSIISNFCSNQVDNFSKMDALPNVIHIVNGFTTRNRSQTYPPNPDDIDPEFRRDAGAIPDQRQRSGSQSSVGLRLPRVRTKSERDRERRRSLSDPNSPGNSVAKFFNSFGFGYLASLALKSAPVVQHVRGQNYDEIPAKKIGLVSTHVLSAYSGPYGGLTNIEINDDGSVKDASEMRLLDGNADSSDEENKVITTKFGRKLSLNSSNNKCIGQNDNDGKRISNWNLRRDWAYGIAVSLYEQKEPDLKACTGDPVADVIAIKATENSAILGVADGCGWGYGARRAARCAIRGCMAYLEKKLYSMQNDIGTTTDIFRIMRESIDEGQKLVLGATATLTTLVLSIITPLANSKDFVVCTVNVGDSLAYVFSEENGVRELTTGSRDMDSHRNIRFCDGALGPALGESPDLTNMTFSLTVVKKGDVVFLTSDGVSDNFDPVIAGDAVASPDNDRRHGEPTQNSAEESSKPVFDPKERQEQTEFKLNDTIREISIPNENLQSAHTLCGKLLQFAIENTQEKRNAQMTANQVVLERAKNPEHRSVPDQFDRTHEGLRDYVRSLPGKLDHASVAAYVVGMHGIPEEHSMMSSGSEDNIDSSVEVDTGVGAIN